MAKLLRILVVDDSLTYCNVITRALKDARGLEVIGSAPNGKIALDMILEHQPDVVTLDVEMPEMDGLQALEAINALYKSGRLRKKIGIIMVSSLTRRGANTTLRALEAGAFDFITKPVGKDPKATTELLQRQLLVKLRCYSVQAVGTPAPQHAPVVREPLNINKKPNFNPRAIVIGVSTGGPSALKQVMPSLCSVTRLPILIVQHMPETFTAALANNLDSICSHRFVEGEEGMPVQEKHAYVAPGGKHMGIKRGNAGKVVVTVLDEPPSVGCKPAANVLFRCAAQIYGGNVICIILTGMGNDGSKGGELLKQEGAYIIAQDKSSSVVWGMPGSAVNKGIVDFTVSLMDIPGVVSRLL